MDVVLASGNRGKLDELALLLDDARVTLRPQSDFDLQSPPETGTTFVENAIIKARNAAAGSGLPAVADDSGLCVAALDGAPGVRSARYAGDRASDADNVAHLLAALDGVAADERACSFVCVMVMLRHAGDPLPAIVTGRWDGRLLEAPRGRGGFGYDPVFWAPEADCSAAELDRATKNRLSHRGQAARELAAMLARLLP